MKWEKGRHSDHDVVVVEVVLRRDHAHGRVTTLLNLQSDEDEALLLEWPSGGLEQVAFGLLQEAVRREAILDVILTASQDPGWLARVGSMTETERDKVVAQLVPALEQTVAATVKRLASTSIREASDLLLRR